MQRQAESVGLEGTFHIVSSAQKASAALGRAIYLQDRAVWPQSSLGAGHTHPQVSSDAHGGREEAAHRPEIQA